MADVTKTPLRNVKNVRALLKNEHAQDNLRAVAASHMNPERMTRLMSTAIQKTPALAECEPMTLLGAMMTCASIGLEPNTVLGHAYLIPFKNRKKGITEVTLVIGYKGMIDLARRSGHVVNIHADVVYEGDEFSFEYGSNQHLHHRPAGSRENPTHAYCHAKLTDGEAFVVLPYEVVLKTRDASQGYKTAIRYGKKDTPWIAHEHAMAKKTAVRALFNELPISVERISDALEADDRQNSFASFAMSPEAGLMPEGDTIEGELAEETDQNSENNTDTDETGDETDTGSTQSETDEATIANAPTDDEAAAGLLQLVKGEILDCKNADEIEATFGLYEDQLKPLMGTAGFAALEKAASDHLKQVAS